MSVDIENFAKLRHRSGSSKNRIKSRRPFISLLHASCFPSAVFLGVRSIIINSANRHSWRSFANIFKKCIERIHPAFANSNSAPAVIWIVLIGFLAAPVLHGAPRPPSCITLFPSGFLARYPYGPNSTSVEASARLEQSAFQEPCPCLKHFSAMTPAHRVFNNDIFFSSRFSGPPSGWTISNDGNSLKYILSDGFFGRHNSVIALLCLASGVRLQPALDVHCLSAILTSINR